MYVISESTLGYPDYSDFQMFTFKLLLFLTATEKEISLHGTESVQNQDGREETSCLRYFSVGNSFGFVITVIVIFREKLLSQSFIKSVIVILRKIVIVIFCKSVIVIGHLYSTT